MDTHRAPRMCSKTSGSSVDEDKTNLRREVLEEKQCFFSRTVKRQRNVISGCWTYVRTLLFIILDGGQ